MNRIVELVPDGVPHITCATKDKNIANIATYPEYGLLDVKYFPN
jgi:sodium/potassium-transporting ATPase subunit beta